MHAWFFNPLHAEATFVHEKNAKSFENHLDPVMLVFIEKLSPSTIEGVPMCQGFRKFSAFLHYFVMTKLVNSSHRAALCHHIGIYACMALEGLTLMLVVANLACRK